MTGSRLAAGHRPANEYRTRKRAWPWTGSRGAGRVFQSRVMESQPVRLTLANILVVEDSFGLQGTRSRMQRATPFSNSFLALLSAPAPDSTFEFAHCRRRNTLSLRAPNESPP